MDYFNQTVKTFSVLFGVLMVGVLLGVFLVHIGYVPVGGEVLPAAILSSQQSADIMVDVAIDYGNGDVQIFPHEVIRSGDSVLDLLSALEMRYGVTTERRNFPGMGVFIEAIHGVRNSNNFYWQYWVNGNYANVSADQYILNDGDIVLWERTNEIEK